MAICENWIGFLFFKFIDFLIAYFKMNVQEKNQKKFAFNQRDTEKLWAKNLYVYV